MKLVKEIKGDICVQDMNDGQIGIITNWGELGQTAQYKNIIVQRYKNVLIVLGKPSVHSWDTLLNADRDETCRVQILGPGTQLEI